jgi:hypothetical protein
VTFRWKVNLHVASLPGLLRELSKSVSVTAHFIGGFVVPEYISDPLCGRHERRFTGGDGTDGGIARSKRATSSESRLNDTMRMTGFFLVPKPMKIDTRSGDDAARHDMW